ncbi:MAG TPA: type 4a pilus biogenesis protein PilO [Syntrophomonadaceae bacterium]|nr:type 4a pilus biogenesis protein PilO [Syntrophomonadaceae bacterium]
MKGWSKRETILFIIALYIFIGMLCYRLAYEPAVAEFHRVQEENQELKKTLHQIKQEEQEVLNQADYVQAAGQQYHALIGSIPRDPQLVELITFFNQAAPQYGVQLVSVQYKESAAEESGKVKEQKQAVERLQVSLEAAGGYYSLVKFLLHLESSPRLLCIQSISLGRKAERMAMATEEEGMPAGAYDADLHKDENAIKPYNSGQMIMQIDMEIYHCPLIESQ